LKYSLFKYKINGIQVEKSYSGNRSGTGNGSSCYYDCGFSRKLAHRENFHLGNSPMIVKKKVGSPLMLTKLSCLSVP
jgi:hypothetical protein